VWLIAEFEEQLEELLPIVGPHWRPNLDLHSGSIYGTAKPNHRCEANPRCQRQTRPLGSRGSWPYHVGQAGLVILYPIALIAGFLGMCLLAYLAWLVTAGLFGALFALLSGGVD
jgi:hypothetical protein